MIAFPFIDRVLRAGGEVFSSSNDADDDNDDDDDDDAS